MRQENNSFLITVVDNDDVPISVAPRNFAISKGYNHRTVHVIAAHNGNAVLQRLSSNHIRSPGLIGSSAAGFVGENESYENTAIRIIQQELRIKPCNLIFNGKTIFHELNYLKFVSVYSICLDEIPSPNPEQFSELIEYDIHFLDALISERPSMFAKTFLSVYPVWRERYG